MQSASEKSSSPIRARGTLLVGLLVLTVAAGVAARIVTAPPTSPPGDGNLAKSAHNGSVQLGATLDRHSVLAGSDGTLRVELVITGDDRPLAQEPTATPTDLVVVLDRSGSMNGQPLQFAKAAVFELLGQLGRDDRFGLVTYASGGAVRIPLERATQGAVQRWQPLVANLGANGGTNMARGLDLAHELVAGSEAAGRSPRVLLISDGHANQGDHSLEGLRRRAARAVPAEYVLSSVGVGQGFDENVMSAVSDAGTGNFYYLPDVAELAGVFADEFASARERVAKALEVFVAPGEGVQVLDAAGIPLSHSGDGARFHPGDLFAGQERRIWLTLRAPTHRLGELDPGDVTLSFSDADGERRRLSLGGLPQIACVQGEDDYYASFDADVYRRGSSSEAIGALKQKVAASLAAGDQDEAQSTVETYLEEMKLEQIRALGYVVSEDAEEVQALRDTVAAPAAAEPEVQNQLGKELLEAGRDSRRVGSKRK